MLLKVDEPIVVAVGNLSRHFQAVLDCNFPLLKRRRLIGVMQQAVRVLQLEQELHHLAVHFQQSYDKVDRIYHKPVEIMLYLMNCHHR